MPQLVADAVASRPPGDDRPVLLMAQDEGRFGRINPVQDGWAPPGVRPSVAQQAVRESVYVFAAVAPALGRMVSWITPHADTALMNRFLQHVSETFADFFIVMQLDGARWHTSGALKTPDNIRVLVQPPYSPELNPVEHLWRYLRKAWVRNRWFKSLDAVTECLIEGIQALVACPEMLTSMTYFPHLRIASLNAS